MSENEVDKDRRRFLTAAAAAVGGAGVVAAAVPFVGYLNPSARTKATGGPVEVDISRLQPGEKMIAKWRGKPIWIMRRTKEELETLPELDDKVADPTSEKSDQPDYAKNESRSRNPEYLVVEGFARTWVAHRPTSPKAPRKRRRTTGRAGFSAPAMAPSLISPVASTAMSRRQPTCRCHRTSISVTVAS